MAAEDFTHISAITFSTDVQLINDVPVFKSNDEFDRAIDNLEYIGNGTLTGMKTWLIVIGTNFNKHLNGHYNQQVKQSTT